MKDLRKHFPKTAFITISQSTKVGKMHGSNELVHNTDIMIKVENGFAVTTRNRYNPTGHKFNVFEAFE